MRNGVAHLGEATADDGDDVLVPYLKASEELRGALDLDREAYWGEFVELVDSALKENVEKARLRAESALAIARQEFEKRFGALDEPTRTAMLRVVENNPEKYDGAADRLPRVRHAGARLRISEGRVRRGLGLPRGCPPRRPPYFMFIPSSPRCNACGLELDGTDEMDVAGIAEPWQLDDVDERDRGREFGPIVANRGDKVGTAKS